MWAQIAAAAISSMAGNKGQSQQNKQRPDTSVNAPISQQMPADTRIPNAYLPAIQGYNGIQNRLSIGAQALPKPPPIKLQQPIPPAYNPNMPMMPPPIQLPPTAQSAKLNEPLPPTYQPNAGYSPQMNQNQRWGAAPTQQQQAEWRQFYEATKTDPINSFGKNVGHWMATGRWGR